MEEGRKYQKLDLDAILEDIQKGNIRLKDAAIRQYANFFEIYTNQFSLETDEVIAISIMLFGVHNALIVSTVGGWGSSYKGLLLQGSVYYVLPKYFVKGETVIAKERIRLSTPHDE